MISDEDLNEHIKDLTNTTYVTGITIEQETLLDLMEQLKAERSYRKELEGVINESYPYTDNPYLEKMLAKKPEGLE